LLVNKNSKKTKRISGNPVSVSNCIYRTSLHGNFGNTNKSALAGAKLEYLNSKIKMVYKLQTRHYKKNPLNKV